MRTRGASVSVVHRLKSVFPKELWRVIAPSPNPSPEGRGDKKSLPLEGEARRGWGRRFLTQFSQIAGTGAQKATANCHPRESGDPEPRHRNGFTLIELLIAIAIVLIVIAGELRVTRLMQRSSSLSRDTEAASAILSSELAELRNRGLEQTEGVVPLPIPVDRISDIPPEAKGELRLTPREDGRLVEAEAVIRWTSVTGTRELTMATLIRFRKEEAP